MKFEVKNHNGTLLGSFDNLEAAGKEAEFYISQTGNSAAIISVYEESDLKSAFLKVANPFDLKGPIEAIIPEKDLNLTAAAIEYYTATQAEFKKIQDGYVRVLSIGYRLGPAGP